jgi:hypothetical protein
MGRIHYNYNTFGFTKLQKFGREVAGVPVKDQKALLTASFGCCMTFEHLLKPGETQLVVGLSRSRVGYKYLVLFGL